jgi:hypothetical protein
MNEKIRKLLKQSGMPSQPLQNDIFIEKFAQLVAEDCAQTCEEMATMVSGCENGFPTMIADDCARWIRQDFGIKEA